MKKRVLCSLLAGAMALLIASCGSSYYDVGSSSSEAVYDSNSMGSYDAALATEEWEGDWDEEPGENAVETGNDGAGESAGIDREMLVYHCTLSIDTLDFDAAVGAFKKSLDTYGGFVENEEFSDGGGYGIYYIERSEKNYTYSATVRVPSAKYEAFLSQAEGIGDVRSRSSYTDNVSTEYGTARAMLEIYQAEYDRYLLQLEKTEDDEVALELQKELTDLMIRIAELKTRMSSLESDVAYSYVNITIRAVEKYETPIYTSTFGDRLYNTWVDSWTTFCEFMEGVLFFFIMAWWYLVIIAVIVIIVVTIAKKRAKKQGKKEKKEKEKQKNIYAKYNLGYPPQPYQAAGIQAPDQETDALGAPKEHLEEEKEQKQS